MIGQNQPDPFGPFRDDCSPLERARMLGLLEAFCHAYAGGQCDAADLLARAQSGRLTDLVDALVAVNALPALQRRRVLGSYGARLSPAPRKIVNGKAKARESVA